MEVAEGGGWLAIGFVDVKDSDGTVCVTNSEHRSSEGAEI